MNLGILLIYGRHLNDRITSQRREAWAHTTRIPFSTLLLNCLYQVSKVCGHVYVYVLGVLILPPFLRFSNWIVGPLWGCCIFSLFILWLSGSINHVYRGFIAHLVLSVHYAQPSYVFFLETLIYSFSHWFLCLILTHQIQIYV
jgi:hypothetical protein